MISFKLPTSVLIMTLVFITACAQTENSDKKNENEVKIKGPVKVTQKKTNPYGGWYCPDNLGGFPPVDLEEFDKIPVVNGRLPSKEEAGNGTSLIFVEKEKYPDARAIDMVFPKLGRYYLDYTEKNEYVVVIQAVEIDNDTIVGFRYLNGGNGSAWFSEIDFLSDKEMNDLGSTPFVFEEIELKATQKEIYDLIAFQGYQGQLPEMLGKKALWETQWSGGYRLEFEDEFEGTVRKGSVSSNWGPIYIQIDYNYSGKHYVEKLFIAENEETKTSTVLLAAGPYGDDFKANKEEWLNWLAQLTELASKE